MAADRVARVAVIGAGLAGLSAALDLQRRGYAVEVFERSRLVGGKATSFVVDGVEVDNGQHVYLACCTEFVNFVRQIEERAPAAGPLLQLQDHFEALLLAPARPPARLRALPLPAPWHLAPALARYPHLSPAARLGLAWALLSARRPALPGETFATWLARHGQSAAARAAFWDPFLVPALNAPLEAVDAEAALFVIRTAFLDDAGAARFGFARAPLGRIAEAAARQIGQVHLRTPITRVAMRIDDGRVSGVELSLDTGERQTFDGVVVAVPPARVTRLLAAPEELGIRGLDAIPTAPIVDVHLWYDVPPLGFGFAALLHSPLQWVFEKAPGYLCCSLSAAHELVEWPSAALIALCQKELAKVLPQLEDARLVRAAATRDREATFVPAPGLRRPGAATRQPRLVLAGAWTDTGWPATMESAVRSGRTAAHTLATHLSDEGGMARG